MSDSIELKRGYYYMSNHHEIVQLIDWHVLGIDYKIIYTPWKRFEGQCQTMKHQEFLERVVIMSKDLRTLQLLYAKK